MATVPYSADLTTADPAAENEAIGGSSRLILWLVVTGLAILLMPLVLISSTLKADNVRLDNELSDIQATLSTTPKPQASDQSLKDTLLQLQKQVALLEAAQPTLAAGHIDWLSVVNAIAAYNPEQITLTGLTQPDTRLVLSGQADSEDSVMLYAQTLRDSNQFKRVIVQSITFRTQPVSAARKGTAEISVKSAEFTISLELQTDTAAR
jgi:Tfp pilus assembly protein PilN